MNRRILGTILGLGLISATVPSTSQDVLTRDVLIRGAANVNPANVGTLTVTTLTAPRTYTYPDYTGFVMVVPPASLNPNAAVRTNGSSEFETVTLGDGQLLIGSAGNPPQLGTITGTVNQISVALGAGSITLSLPQNIHTGATPTFAGATLHGNLSVTTGGATIVGNTAINGTGAGTTNIGSSAGGNITIGVNDGTSNLILTGITNAAVTGDILWIDGTNQVRRGGLAGSALEGLEYQTAAYRLGGQNATTNPLTSTRYINVDGQSLYFTVSGGANELIHVSGANQTVGVGNASNASYTLSSSRTVSGGAAQGALLGTAVNNAATATAAVAVTGRATTDGSYAYGLDGRATYNGTYGGGLDLTRAMSGVIGEARNGGTNVTAIGGQFYATTPGGGDALNIGSMNYADNAGTGINVGIIGSGGVDIATLAGGVGAINTTYNNIGAYLRAGGTSSAALVLESTNSGAVIDASAAGLIIGETTTPVNGIELGATGFGVLIGGGAFTAPTTGISIDATTMGVNVQNATTSFSGDGNTIFGDTDTDTHEFVGALTVNGGANTGTTVIGNTAAGGSVQILAANDVTINVGAPTNDLVLNNILVDNTLNQVLTLTGFNQVRSTALGEVAWLVGGNTFAGGGTYTVGTNSADDFALESGGTTRLVFANGSATATSSVNLLPNANNSLDLGSDALRWRDFYVNGSSLHVGPSGGQAANTELAIGYAAGIATFNVDAGAAELSLATTGLTVNTGGGADLSISQAAITRNADLDISTTGAGNSVNISATGGGASNVVVNGANHVRLISGDQLSLRSGTGGVLINDNNTNPITIGATTNTGALQILRSGNIVVNPGAGNAVTTNGSLNVAVNVAVTGNTTIDGNTTLGNAAGDAVTINAATISAPNVPVGTASEFIVRNGTALERRTINNIVTGTGTNGRMTRWGAGNTIQDGSLNDDGAGVLSFPGGGNISINPGAGNLILTNGGITSAGNITISAGGLSVGAGGITVTLGGLVVSAGGATISGTATFNNDVVVTGNETVTGTLTANGNSILGDVAGDQVTINAGTIVTNNLPAYTTGDVFVVRSAANQLQARTIANVVSGTGTNGRMTRWGAGNTLQDASLNDDGAGTLSFPGGGNININPGAGNRILTNGGITSAQNVTITSGGLIVTAGGLTVTSGDALLSSGNLTLTSGNLLLSAGNATVTGNITATGSLTANGNTVLGDAAGDQVTLNAATVTAANLPAYTTGDVFVVRNGANNLEARTISNIVSGTGTATRMTRWTSGTAIGNASLTDDGSGVLAFGGNIELNPGAGNRILTNGGITSAQNVTVTSGGVTITAGGLSIAAGDATVTTGNLTVTAGDLAVTAGNATVGNNLSVNGVATLGNAATDGIILTGEIRGATPLRFEGATDNDVRTEFAITDPTGARTITFPDASGTVALLSPSAVGVVDYGTTVQQTLAVANGTRFLFDVAYGSATGNANGARVSSSAAGFAGGNSTGLTVQSVADAAGTSVGLSLAASGGTSNHALDVTNGTIRAAATSILDAADMSNRELMTYNTSTNIIERVTVAEALGGTPVLYGPTAPQSTVGVGSTRLLDVRYSGTVTGAVNGAQIQATAIDANSAATGLTIAAVATGTAAGTGVSVSATSGTGAANAIDVTAGDVQLSSTSRIILQDQVVAPATDAIQVIDAARVTLTLPAGGVGNFVALAAGTEGEVLYLRVVRDAGTIGIIELRSTNAGGAVLDIYPTTTAQNQLKHMMYINGRWHVLSTINL